MKRAPGLWLAAIVGASFAVRCVVGWLRATPALFPDEYIYSALGRSLADSGRPSIRGGSADFPALLQPIVTAPAWLIDDVEVAFRVVQAIEALAMSLAAVPVYLLARRLGLTKAIGLAVAALAVLVPDLVYASFVSSEALAYPLVLAAVYCGVSALVRPSRRPQLGFVVFAGLAAFTRVQFALLPLVFALALVLIGLREGRLRTALREQRLVLGVFAIPALAVVAAGSGRALGYYDGVLGLRPDPLAMIKWMGLDAMALAYASGWIVVPGALIGLWLALARPQRREELAFACFTVVLTLTLLAQAGIFQANPEALHGQLAAVNGIKERYVFYVVPLAGLAFAMYARRGWPCRIWHLALAAALLIVSVRIPLSGFAVPATVNASPILYGVSWLTGELGRASSAATAVAVGAAVLSGVAVLASRRPRLGTPLALSLALVAAATSSAGAVAYEVTTASQSKRTYIARDPSFVDRAEVGRVPLLVAENTNRSASFQTLFWNRSVDRVLLLPGAASFDTFASENVRVAPDGTMLVRNRPLTGPVLVDDFGSTVRLRDARVAIRGPVSTLWTSSTRPRLALYLRGRYSDAWLAGRGTVTVWPAAAGQPLRGRLTMTLSLPSDRDSVSVRFSLPGHSPIDVRVRPGAHARVVLDVCSTGPWRATFQSRTIALAGLRIVTARATVPVFTPVEAARTDQAARPICR